MFYLLHVAIKRCAMKAISIGCTQLSSRDRYLIHETQNLFGNIVRGVISPLLANIALHGMEEAIGVKHTAQGHIKGTRAVVRYADDVRHLIHNEILLAEKGGSEENDLRVISPT
jgi:hypothetical protein